MPKILIADDEPHIRLLLEQTLEDLEQEGVDLIFAEDGDQALKMIQEEMPDLAILDAVSCFLGRLLEVEDLKFSLRRLENALAITKAVVEDSSIYDPKMSLPNLRYRHPHDESDLPSVGCCGRS